MGVKYDTPLPASIYPDVGEASRRLQGTVVKHNNRGVYVDQVYQERPSSPIMLTVREIATDNKETLPITDPGFNRFAAFPLGFCNYFNVSESGRVSRECILVERVPSRGIPQGLYNRNVSTSMVSGGPGPNWDRIRNSDGFAEMLREEYPEYLSALSMLVDDGFAIAIHPRYALRRASSGFIFLMKSVAGAAETIGIAGSDKIILPKSRSHMKKSLADNKNLPPIVEVIE